jgi:hypothetical protein
MWVLKIFTQSDWGMCASQDSDCKVFLEKSYEGILEKLRNEFIDNDRGYVSFLGNDEICNKLIRLGVTKQDIEDMITYDEGIDDEDVLKILNHLDENDIGKIKFNADYAYGETWRFEMYEDKSV